jgi:pilus assembly protein FimV
MAMRSFLNEPLAADVELLDLRGLTADDIRIRLAGVEDFDRLGIDRSYFLTSIEFEIDIDDDTGRGVIRLSTEDAVLEPYLDLVIEARWPTGRLLREYTVLVDPPTFRQETVTVSASEEVARTEAAAEPRSETVDADSATEQTGDTVRRLESDLPPGEMPARPFSAETSETPRAGSRYMVRRDETLWEIASRARPEGVAVQQAMLDIQRLNPEAFIQGNINRIKAGYIIYLPSAQDISSDDLAEALEEVRQQNRDFAAGAASPGVTAAATLRVSAAPAPQQTAESADTGAASGPTAENVEGVERVEGVEGVEGARSAAAGERDASQAGASAAAEASAPAGDSAAESAASGELAAQLDAMAQRLDTLEEIVSLKDQQIAALEQALREAREAAAAAAAAPVPAPAAATPAAQAPPQRPGGLPWLPIGGGVLVVLALLLLLVLRRRAADSGDTGDVALPTRGRTGRADNREDDVFAGVSLDKEALAGPETAAPGETLEERLQREEREQQQAVEAPAADNRGYGERKHDDYIDEGAAGDALAEADIYIAYGRYLQAIELLDTAIDDEPDNTAYRLKLIELYVDMGEEENAAEQLEKLRASGDSDAIARGEALVGASAGSAAASAGGAGAPDSVASPEEATPIDSAAAVAEADDSLSLELEAAEDAPASVDTLIDGGDDVDSLELADDMEFEDLQIDEDLEVVEDLDDEGVARRQDDGPPAEALDFTDALEGISLDEGDVGAAPGSAAGSLDRANDDANGEDMVIAEDADQMATKLDLARAYLDMGDSDGARVILEEVLSAGNGEQQQEARELLSRID